MSARVLLLCVAASIAGPCVCLSLMRNLSPPRETSSTTLRLTAQRNDTGSWTTKFGHYHMTIEHKHFNVPGENDKEDGTWTLKVKHTTTTFEEKPEDEDPVKLNQNFSIYENKPEEEEEDDDESNLNANVPEVMYVEKPDEDSVRNLMDTVHEENAEEEDLQNLTPLALRYEGHPEEEEILNLENTSPEEKQEEEEVSVPDRSTVLNILEHYRNHNNNNDEDDNVEPSVISAEFSNSEVVSTITTTEDPFIAGVPMDKGPLSPERRVSPDFGKMTSEEREHYHMNEERKQIMDRYPRSRALDPASLGYSFYPDVGWLKLNTAHWQWDVAKKSCQADGGHLVVPDTLAKIKTFTRILKNSIDVIERAVLKNQVFVGVYDPNNSRRFTTVKGEPFIPESVSIWFPNEPNDADPGEDCVTLHLEGKLRDVPCFFNLPFMCQIDFSDAPVKS